MFPGLGLMACIVINHARERRIRLGRLAGLEEGEQVLAPCPVLAWPCAVAPRPGRPIERPGPVVLVLLPRRHPGPWGPLRPPGTPHFRPQGDLPCVGTDQRLVRSALFEDPPEAGQAVAPLRLIIVGDPRGPLPAPADRVAPAPPRLRRDDAPPFGLPGQGQRGTAPTWAAPPRRPRGCLAQGQQRPAQGGEQHRGAHRWQKPALVIACPAEGALPRGAHGAVDAGTRAAQDRGDRRRPASSRTPPPDVGGQHIALSRAPPRGPQLGLLLRRHVEDRTLGHGGVSSRIHGGRATSAVSERHLAVPI